MSETHERLTRGEIEALTSWLGGLPSMSPQAGAAEQSACRAATGFDMLPAYLRIQVQADTAARLGLPSPFFRLHESRNGPQTCVRGQPCTDFASYDYLGLSRHDRVIAAAKAAIDQHGTSVSGSRVVAGERPLHRLLERRLADLYHAEDAAVFVSGHATNVSAISVIVGPGDLVLQDAAVHNSVLLGAELSKAARRSFPHNDLDVLEAMLREHTARFANILIVVEGLYSMDGDTPDLARLIALKERFGAWLMVDDAHGLGVLGESGRGIWEHAGVDPRRVDIWMGTLSKTLAATGGYIAGCQALIDLMKFAAPGFVYSVGLAPAQAAAALAALDVMEREPERVKRLAGNGALFRRLALAAGLDIGASCGRGIVPVMTGDSLRAVTLSERLLARGINVVPVIHPAVPPRAARLRFFLTAEHAPEQIGTAVEVMRQEFDALGAWTLDPALLPDGSAP
jgi:8-amino-7-oxononanoate synthase